MSHSESNQTTPAGHKRNFKLSPTPVPAGYVQYRTSTDCTPPVPKKKPELMIIWCLAFLFSAVVGRHERHHKSQATQKFPTHNTCDSSREKSVRMIKVRLLPALIISTLLLLFVLQQPVLGQECLIADDGNKKCDTHNEPSDVQTTATTSTAANVVTTVGGAASEEKLAIMTDSAKYGTRQRADDGASVEATQTLEVMRSTREYMESEQVLTLPSQIRDNCKNQHQLCSFWAVIGRCSLDTT
jgi:hypothetical protein